MVALREVAGTGPSPLGIEFRTAARIFTRECGLPTRHVASYRRERTLNQQVRQRVVEVENLIARAVVGARSGMNENALRDLHREQNLREMRLIVVRLSGLVNGIHQGFCLA